MTHRGRGCIDLGSVTEPVPFKGQESMHVADIPQIFLPSRFRTDRLFPGVDELEDTCHDGSGEWRWPFRKPTDELIEELFRAYLQMEWISTRLNEGVEECKSQHGDMGISMIDEPDGQRRSFPRSVIIQISVDPVIQRTVLRTYWTSSGLYSRQLRD